MTKKLPSIDLNRPFVLNKLPNGGWVIGQDSVATPFSPPGTSNHPSPNVLGAYSSAEDLLATLTDVLNPPPPEKVVITEVPPFDISNHEGEWLPMSYAPRTGVYIRIEDDEGSRHRPMKFTAPYWWDAPNGELRLADVGGAGGEPVARAVKWRPLSPEEDARYNARPGWAVAPVPAQR